jgi:hypothetical protein
MKHLRSSSRDTSRHQWIAGPLGGDPAALCNGHDAVDEREQLSDVVAVPDPQSDRQRYPGGVHQQVVLRAGASAVNRRRPVRPPLKGADVARVHDSPQPVDPARGVQAAEKTAVQSLPHPCALPLPQPPPSGHPGTADLPRDHRPRYPTHQHEHDRRERSVRSLTRGRPVRCGV